MSSKQKALILESPAAGTNWLFARHMDVANASMYTTGKVYAKDFKNIDLVVFGGGPDVNPELYGQTADKKTVFKKEWDEWRVRAFDYAVKYNKPMVGICGGAQFGCVMAGGTLIQDHKFHLLGMNGRHSAALMLDNVPDINFKVTSDHHQSMEPFVAQQGKTVNALVAARDMTDKYPEVVWFPTIKFLAVQYHPEWMTVMDDAVKIFKALIGKFCYGNHELLVTTVNSILDERVKDSSANTTLVVDKPVKYETPTTILGMGNNVT